MTARFGRLCFLPSSSDICSQTFIHSGKIIFLLDTKSLNEITGIKVLLSQFIGWGILWLNQFPVILRNDEQQLGRASSQHQQQRQSWAIVRDPSLCALIWLLFSSFTCWLLVTFLCFALWLWLFPSNKYWNSLLINYILASGPLLFSPLLGIAWWY